LWPGRILVAAPSPKRFVASAASAGASAATVWESLRTPSVPSWEELEARLSSAVDMPPVEFWLVRHGETTTNVRGLVTGTSDAPLTPNGRQQAQDAGLLLSDHVFQLAWSSALRRSRETLEEILQASANRPETVFEDERIDERSLGELELSPARRIEQFARGDLTYAPSGGEPYESVAQRCLAFLLDIAVLSREVDRSLKLLVCSHVGPVRVVAGILKEMNDPAEVLRLPAANSTPMQFEIARLEFPAFVIRSRELYSQRA
jgi:broad specificity phosphatase PhoE